MESSGDEMKTITIKIHQCDKWWVIMSKDLSWLHTQGRTIKEALEMAADVDHSHDQHEKNPRLIAYGIALWKLHQLRRRIIPLTKAREILDNTPGLRYMPGTKTGEVLRTLIKRKQIIRQGDIIVIKSRKELLAEGLYK
jgi:hypothetical protein